MYRLIPPNPNAKHNLPQYLSRRAESKLESFHDNLSHFANSGMRRSLADNLNLCGTARYNLAIRHKLLLTQTGNPTIDDYRKRIPAGWEEVVSYYNHTELTFINRLARDAAGTNHKPFENVEWLPPDSGERFFSEYLSSVNPSKQIYDNTDRCLCKGCQPIPINEMIQETTKKNTTNSQPQYQAPPQLPVAATKPPQLSQQQLPRNATTDSTKQKENQYQRSLPPVPALPPLQFPPPYSTPPMIAAPMLLPLVFPFPWMVGGQSSAAPMLANMPYCCERHRAWSQQANRFGRPPHDTYCHRRLAAASKKRDKNP
jgi:hypothetical protein